MKGISRNVNLYNLVSLSLIAALGGFLFGYDTAVISGTIQYVTEYYHLNAVQQGWYVGCALIGSILGVLCAGILCDKYGRKTTMFFSSILFSVSAIGCALYHTFDELVFFRIIGGIGIGVVSIASPLYIAELSVPQYRGRLVALYQLAVTIGILSSYLVNYGILAYSELCQFQIGWYYKIFVSEVWRAMLGMETIPALIFLIIVMFIPESPRFLLLQNKEGRAFKVLSKVYVLPQDILEQIGLIKQTLSNQKRISEWKLLFQGGILRAVIIGACIALLGQFMGINAVLLYGPSIFDEAGFSGSNSLLYQVLIGLVNSITTIIALLIMDKIGRKTLIYYGVSGMIISLLWISIYFTFSERLQIPGWILLIGFLGYIFCCAISVCAVIFIFLSEMYPTRVRGIAMSIAGFSLWIGTYLIGQLTPYILEKLGPSGTFILFTFMCVPYLLIVWKLMPETAGKSLEEIETYWNKFN